jgi:hypothetical protein
MILDNIKQGTMELSELNHQQFIEDYVGLHQMKPTAAFSELVSEIKRNPAVKPFVKGHFDRLINKYNYFRYKQTVLDDKNTRLLIYLFTCGKSQEEKELINRQIVAYIITETYIGFMVEYVLAERLRQQGKRVHQNNVLDIDYKTDLLVCGRHYQIKNCSFIETSWVENKLKEYGKANRRLYFIFYTTTTSGIWLLRIGNQCAYKWDSIDDFTQLLEYEKLELNEFIASIMER